MKIKIAMIVTLAAAMIFSGCETLNENPKETPEERAIRAFDFQGVKIGSPSGALATFPQVQRMSGSRQGMMVYEIFNPTPEVSLALAYYQADKLRKLELRYFNGPGVRTLTRAGGWIGIRDYLISKYGPPSRFGPDASVVTSQPGIQAKYAKFNGEWIFSRANRQLNYIAMADGNGGVGIVTIADTTPLVVVQQPTPAPTPMRRVIMQEVPPLKPAPEVLPTPVRPNPGF